ncbi:MAG: hypothetical protein RIQ60_2092 [Pseudomonadota bacterium]|jgi:endoglucanase
MHRRHAIAYGLAGLSGVASVLSACSTGAPTDLAAAAAATNAGFEGPACREARAGADFRADDRTGNLPVGASNWPDWQAFRQALLKPEGRIADPRDGRFHTVSEAQAYALFFALVSNDRPTFDALLGWTERELARGDLGVHLPAWHWGRDERGRWRVLDSNAASDADLWIAYVLAQAARLWNAPALRAKAQGLGRLILARETAELPGLGLQLLPAPVGFLDRHGNAKLNPSYLPLPLLRWWAMQGADPAWPRLLNDSVHLLRLSAAPHGLVPDWYLPAGNPLPAAMTLSTDEARGGYNAIRSYLWLGLTDAADPARAGLLAQHVSVCDIIERLGDVPLSLHTGWPAPQQPLNQALGPRGFAAALLPLARALGRERAAGVLRQRLAREAYLPQHYYDSALALFALGHEQGRYRFDAGGRLVLPWADCSLTAATVVSAREATA